MESSLILDLRGGYAYIRAMGQVRGDLRGERSSQSADQPDSSRPEGECCLDDGTTIRLRPIGPADVSACERMLSQCSPKSLYSRYERLITAAPLEMAKELCEQNPHCDLTLVAEVMIDDEPTIIGVAQLLSDSKRVAAEYAVLVADPWQGRGLGGTFTSFCLQVAYTQGIGRVIAEFLPDNMRMIRILEARDFDLHRDLQERVVSGQKMITDERTHDSAGSMAKES
ncbi:MAG: GNAT family N-acetyltransferase [Candidatus Bipolaricaulota bacterium]